MSGSYSRNKNRSPSGHSSRGSRSPSPRYEKRGRRSSPSRSPPRRTGRNDKFNPDPNNTIGIFGLSLRTTEDQLSRQFEKYGKIERIKLVLDRETNESRGFCFIDYEDIESATRAIKKANGMDIDGRPVRIDYSISKNGERGPPQRGGRNDDRGFEDRRSARKKSRSRSFHRRSRSRSPRRRSSRSRSNDRYGKQNRF